jgi:OTU domain-containing protein 6
MASSELWQLEKRHEKELTELELTVSGLRKAAKKSNRAAIEAQIIQLQYDIRAKHRDELEALESRDDVSISDAYAELELIKQQEKLALKKQTIDNLESIERKKSKSKSKQEKKLKKEIEIALSIEQSKQSAGPSLRDIEIEQIKRTLLAESLDIRVILSDGNCLYRAVEDQLRQTSVRDQQQPTWTELRIIAANHIRKNPSEYAPFLGFSTSLTAEELVSLNDYCEFCMLCYRP